MTRSLSEVILKFAVAALFATLIMVINPSVHAGQEAEVTKNLPPNLELVDFSYFLDKDCEIQKGSCLTIKMTLKNTGDKPQRYITKITLPDEGKSVGGFVPAKGKKDKATGKSLPPAVAPGKEVTVSYPMFYNKIPGKIELEIGLYE